MSKKKEKFIEGIKDLVFAVFYFGLYVLEILPSFAMIFLELSNPLLWVIFAVGIVAMFLQVKNFGCHNIITFQAGVVAGTIAMFLAQYVL